MSNYIKQNKIHAYPVTNKPSEPNSRLNTEKNLIYIINRLVDKDSFVVTSNFISGKGTILNYATNLTEKLMFNIHGYLFETTIGDIVTAVGQIVPGQRIYASIYLTTSPSTDGLTSFEYLIGGEINAQTSPKPDGAEENDYTGVKFTIGEPSIPDDSTIQMYKLCILDYTASGLTIPRESKIRFNQWALEGLDDGDLDNSNTLYIVSEVNTGVQAFEVTDSGVVDLSTLNGVEVVTSEENSSKSVAVLNTDITLKVASNVNFEIVPNTIDLAGHTFAIEGGEDSKVANFEANEDTEGKVVLKNITVLGVEQ